MMNSWVWIVLALIFGVIELFTLGLTTCWFLVGALAAYLAAWLGVPWDVQVGIFLFTAIILLIFFRPLAKDYFKIGAVRTGIPALIGKVGIVQEKIVPYKSGVITVQGQVWTAESLDNETIEVNEKVIIIEIEGVILKVKKLKEY
jgi:membrane protein implicated in regulation of membrane protease activity